MCNLYNLTTTQQAVLEWTRAMRDLSGNWQESMDIYPDYPAPIVRVGEDGKRELALAKWGMPSSQFALMQAAKKRAEKLEAKGKAVDFKELLKMEPDGGTTNIRNTDSKHWQRWLGVENRCLVPFTSFAEPDPANKPEGGRTPNAWFSVSSEKPIAFFAGIWIPQWESVRKVKDGLTKNDLYAFLTTEPNGVVKPVHQKAMPVILTSQEEADIWLTGQWDEAKKLQRPLRDDQLAVVDQQSL